MQDRDRPRARLELPAPPRSLAELRFFLAEAPCDRCRKAGLACELELVAAGFVLARCAHCHTRREIAFAPPASSVRPPAFSLAEGEAPSALFDAERLGALATRELSRVASHPSTLGTLVELSASRRSLARARTALVELAKLTSLDAAQQLAQQHALDLWERHEVAAAQVEARPGALAPPPPSTLRSDSTPGAIERALLADEAQLAVRDDSSFCNELLLYALRGGRLTLRASLRLSDDGAEAMREKLRSLGVRQARRYWPGEHIWTAEGGFTIWSKDLVVADGRDGVLELASGAVVRKADARRVVSFLDEEDIAHRGVAVELRDGSRVVVAEERDTSSYCDPTYGMDNVMLDAAWATFLGRDLKAWLGVEHTDELP